MLDRSTMLDRIAQAVRVARTKRALSLEALAKSAGVPSEVLVALEEGRRGVTLSQLGHLATALEVDDDALLDGVVRDRPRASVFFRQGTWQDYRHQDDEVFERVMEQARACVALRDMLPPTHGLRLRKRGIEPQAVGAKTPVEAAREGYALARSVREALGRTSDCLLDLRSILEKLFDVPVWVASLASPVPAVSLVDGDRVAVAVVLNANDRTRQDNPLVDRVHLAHELCHVLFDESEPGRIHLVLEHARDNSGDLVEARARGFAAELLLPRRGLQGLLGEPGRVTSELRAMELIQKARGHFVTPWEIAAHHLGNLHFIEKRLADELARRGGNAGASPDAGLSLPPVDAPPIVLLERVKRAWDDALITDGQAREALSLGPGEPLPFQR